MYDRQGTCLLSFSKFLAYALPSEAGDEGREINFSNFCRVAKYHFEFAYQYGPSKLRCFSAISFVLLDISSWK